MKYDNKNDCYLQECGRCKNVKGMAFPAMLAECGIDVARESVAEAWSNNVSLSVEV